MIRSSRRVLIRPLMVLLCATACAAVTALSMWPPATDVRTEDQNGDGRPDVWRAYDRQGQLATVSVDSNFDGRSDIHEYYDRDGLVRRDSDRDFNDRVDLVEEFNSATREHVRSVVDVDFDGTADLLVLFQAGRPVFSEWARTGAPAPAGGASRTSAAAAGRTADAQLAPLSDPFHGDLAARSVNVQAGSGDFIGLSTSGGLPAAFADQATGPAPSSRVSAGTVSDLATAAVGPHSPRGPPSTLLLA